MPSVSLASWLYLGSDTPAAMTCTAMTIRVNSRVTRSKSFHPIGLKIPIAYGPMMIPNAVATTAGMTIYILKTRVSKEGKNAYFQEGA